MATITEIKSQLASALADARAGHDTLPRPKLRELELRVDALQTALCDAISDGAKPCPKCGAKPIGMEQPAAGGGVEYLVGCLACDYHEHDDGTLRHPHVRGGLIPRHTVEVWNEGIDSWAKVTKPEKAEAYAKRKATREAAKAHDAKTRKATPPAQEAPAKEAP